MAGVRGRVGRPFQRQHTRLALPLADPINHPLHALALPRTPPSTHTHSQHTARTLVSCSRVAAAPVGLLGEQKKMMSVRGTCLQWVAGRDEEQDVQQCTAGGSGSAGRTRLRPDLFLQPDVILHASL